MHKYIVYTTISNHSNAHSNYTWTQPCQTVHGDTSTHFGYVEQSQNSGGSDEEGHTENGGIRVDVLQYTIGAHKQHSERDGRHVDSTCHSLCVVETFDLYPPCGKCQKQRENLNREKNEIRGILG